MASLFNYREILEGKKPTLETWPAYWLVHMLEVNKEDVNLKGNLLIDRSMQRFSGVNCLIQTVQYGYKRYLPIIQLSMGAGYLKELMFAGLPIILP